MTEIFEVRLLKIPVFDQETGAEIREDEQYTICNKEIGSENYPCYDKRTADELCEYLNILTTGSLLDNELPAETILENVKGHIKGLAKRVNEKHALLDKIQASMNNELVWELMYLEKSNEIRLHPDKVKEEYGLSKAPTEKQINAYCEKTFTKEFKNWKIAKANTSLLNKQVDLVNDYISVNKYGIRMELQQ